MTAPAVHLVHLPRVTTTMDVLDGLIARGAPELTVVLADEQTAGLGRAGRRWEAAPGTAMTCSILVRPRLPAGRLGMLAIAAGVAVADYAGSLGAEVALKWPNDVLLDGRKLAGVLVRTRVVSGELVANVGIGLNLRRGDDGSDWVDRAALSEVVEPPSAPEAATAVAGRLAALIEGGDLDAVRDAWTRRAWMVDEEIEVEDAGRVHAGVLRGIDGTGALLVETLREVRAVTAGELTRGPRCPGVRGSP